MSAPARALAPARPPGTEDDDGHGPLRSVAVVLVVSYRSEEATPQQDRASREPEHAGSGCGTPEVRGGLAVDARELEGVRRRALRSLGCAVGHALRLRPLGAD